MVIDDLPRLLGIRPTLVEGDEHLLVRRVRLRIHLHDGLDKKAGIYKPGRGYFKNPTRTDLEKAAQGDSIMFDGEKATGTFMYVLDTDGHIVFGARRNPYNSNGRSPHPTLIGGKNPVVQAAGLMNIEGGRIASFNDQSGHFRPSSKSMDKVEAALRKLYDKNHNLFSKDFTWRKK